MNNKMGNLIAGKDFIDYSNFFDKKYPLEVIRGSRQIVPVNTYEQIKKEEESEVKEVESEMMTEGKEFEKDEEQSINKSMKEVEEFEKKEERTVNNEISGDEEFEKDEEQSINNDIKEEEKEKQEQYKRFNEEDTRDLNKELSK